MNNRNPNAPRQQQNGRAGTSAGRSGQAARDSVRSAQPGIQSRGATAGAGSAQRSPSSRTVSAGNNTQQSVRSRQYDPGLVNTEIRRKKEAGYREAEQKRKNMRSVGVKIAMTLVFYVILFGVFALFFSIKLSHTNAADDSSFRYTYGNAAENVSARFALNSSGDPMVDFSKIAEMCSMKAAGDDKEMKFIASDSEENVRFVIGGVTVFINGVQDALSCPSVKNGASLWVPLDFVTDCMSGLTVESDLSSRRVSVKRTENEGSTASAPSFAPVSYSLKSFTAFDQISEDDLQANRPGSQTSEPEKPTFISDLSAYEEYMNPSGNKYLSLVNYITPLSSSYIPDDLTDVADTRSDRAKVQLRKYAAKALEALFIEMRANGIMDVSVTSAYRSYEYQKQLHNSYNQNELATYGMTWAEAKQKVITYSSEPGTSEHQTGLCVDMHNLPSADISFARTEAYRWLKENAHKFGFILRYPEEKVNVTQISFEPWHYRYVGRYHATKMYESGMCLEEYVVTIKS